MLRHPFVVLVAAIVLPGVGHVLTRLPVRGLVFVFYMVLLGTITYQLTTPDHSLVGRYAGGLFIYAISVLDAYTWAARRARTAVPAGEASREVT
ncbi:hypothetical protein H7X46_20150 [Pseudonocardia sp. C8]|uniref:hypothetical protein n=1 Tax=Pseudonocardia sp. C8 TaxID=2762759 RepID=UPI001643399E|nr:hypothetical protein [Pseudonocardia sp. C8]MBC3193377.1 hypothetical protein [Pseudonocardia sp. C8]